MTLRTRKIIFWSAIIVLSAVLLIFWVESAQKKLENFQKEEFIEKLNFPKVELSKIEIIKNAEETPTTTAKIKY